YNCAVTRVSDQELRVGRKVARKTVWQPARSLYRHRLQCDSSFSICATQQACGLATPQPPLQSATMSVMRHTARTGADEPQVSHELAGRQFRIGWIQNRRRGHNARS